VHRACRTNAEFLDEVGVDFHFSLSSEPHVVEISVAGDKVVFEVEGFDKLWTLRSRLEMPLAHIRGARADPAVARGWFHGWRLMGTNIPGILTAGLFHQDGNNVFWDVHDPERTIVIALDHEFYDQLIIEVPDPAAAIALLESKIGSAGD
jgi:hypothetical protein